MNKCLLRVTREQQYTIVGNLNLNTCTLQPNKNSQIWPNPNMSHGQNQSLNYQIRNQNLDHQNYNQSLIYQKSNQHLNYQKSNQSLAYQKSNQSLNYQKSNQSRDTFISFPKQSTHNSGNQSNKKLQEWNKPIIIQKKTGNRNPSRSFSGQKTYKSNRTTMNSQSNKASILTKFCHNDLLLQNPSTEYRENTFTQPSKITLAGQSTQKPQIYQPCKNLIMSQTNQNQPICQIYEKDEANQKKVVHSVRNQSSIGLRKIENGKMNLLYLVL